MSTRPQGLDRKPRSKVQARFSQTRSGLVSFLLVLCALIAGPVLQSGCTTKPAVSDVMLPYMTVRNVVLANLPFGMRKQSVNGRELESHYFLPTSLFEEVLNQPDRAYAQVVILGSSRPFQLTVRVFHERLNRRTKKFELIGEQPKLAKELTRRLKAALADRREDRNLIDDIRPF